MYTIQARASLRRNEIPVGLMNEKNKFWTLPES
jgi:hypothetical protein